MNNSSVLDALRRATEGLLLMSENDYPLTPFVWPAAEIRRETIAAGLLPCSAADLLAYRGFPPDSPVETRTFEHFLAAMCEDQIGDPPDLLATRMKFRDLRDLLPTLLENRIVYRVGHIRIQAFMMGTVPETGDLAGLETLQIET